MKKIVECIPNFSEGKRKDVVEAIVNEIKKSGVELLDYLYDPDYNRAVVTFLGEPEKVKKAALASAKRAIELIDMERHTGQHPRIGAVDVVPFVPIRGVSMEECIKLAKDFGKELAERYCIPVYLYAEAALRPERRDLDFIRRGEYEGLKREITKPERRPDFGPPRMHPTAGATITGARDIMVGFNVNLGTADIKIAKEIAKAVHEKKGGLRYVKAMGAKLRERDITQIGMSITNYKKMPLYRVLELIKIEAKRYGVEVIGSEFCGLVPIDAVLDVAEFYLRLENRPLRDKILELRYLK